MSLRSALVITALLAPSSALAQPSSSLQALQDAYDVKSLSDAVYVGLTSLTTELREVAAELGSSQATQQRQLIELEARLKASEARSEKLEAYVASLAVELDGVYADQALRQAEERAFSILVWDRTQTEADGSFAQRHVPVFASADREVVGADGWFLDETAFDLSLPLEPQCVAVQDVKGAVIETDSGVLEICTPNVAADVPARVPVPYEYLVTQRFGITHAIQMAIYPPPMPVHPVVHGDHIHTPGHLQD